MISGDFSAAKISPAPRYPFFRVPTAEYQSLNRLGIDFAQVYFPSKAFSLLENNYSKGAFEPLQRPSRYAPFLHYLCAVSICKFNFGLAAFLHMLLQMACFYFSFWYAFRRLGLKRYLGPSVLLVNYTLFLTPVGITWFERGQFSLYVALAYLWLILGLQTRNRFFILLSALFSFIKWTSLPFVFVILIVNILVNARITSLDLKALKSSFLFAGLFAAVFGLLSLPFTYATKSYLLGLYRQELIQYGEGLSLMIFLPRVLIKTLPLLLIGLGWLAARRLKETLLLVPFFAGAAVILITYPTLAYDYSMPVLLGFIPLLMAWASLKSASSELVNATTVALFFIFLLGASFSKVIRQTIPIVGADVLWYVLAGLSLICLPLLYPPRWINKAH